MMADTTPAPPSPNDRHHRALRLVGDLERRGFRLSCDDRGLHVQPRHLLTDAEGQQLRELRDGVVAIVRAAALAAPGIVDDPRYPISKDAPFGKVTDEELREIGRHLGVEYDARGIAKRDG